MRVDDRVNPQCGTRPKDQTSRRHHEQVAQIAHRFEGAQKCVAETDLAKDGKAQNQQQPLDDLPIVELAQPGPEE